MNEIKLLHVFYEVIEDTSRIKYLNDEDICYRIIVIYEGYLNGKKRLTYKIKINQFDENNIEEKRQIRLKKLKELFQNIMEDDKLKLVYFKELGKWLLDLKEECKNIRYQEIKDDCIELNGEKIEIKNLVYHLTQMNVMYSL